MDRRDGNGLLSSQDFEADFVAGVQAVKILMQRGFFNGHRFALLRAVEPGINPLLTNPIAPASYPPTNPYVQWVPTPKGRGYEQRGGNALEDVPAAICSDLP